MILKRINEILWEEVFILLVAGKLSLVEEAD